MIQEKTPDEIRALSNAELLVYLQQPRIHPAKHPMEGGFSLEKFMPDTDPETARALGEMLDEMEAANSCVWTEDDGMREVFDTTCKNRFEFNEEGPDENGFSFCPYCGKKLAAVYADNREN